MKATLLKIDKKRLQTWRLENEKLIVVEPKESGVPNAVVGQQAEARCKTTGVYHGWCIVGECDE